MSSVSLVSDVSKFKTILDILLWSITASITSCYFHAVVVAVFTLSLSYISCPSRVSWWVWSVKLVQEKAHYWLLSQQKWKNVWDRWASFSTPNLISWSLVVVLFVISLIFSVVPSCKDLCKEAWRRIWLSCPGKNTGIQYVVRSIFILLDSEGGYGLGFYHSWVRSTFLGNEPVLHS